MSKRWDALLLLAWAVFVSFTGWTIVNSFLHKVVPYVTRCPENETCDLTNIGAIIIGVSFTAVVAIYIYQKQREHAIELAGIEERVVKKLEKKEIERTGHAQSSFSSDLEQVKSLIQGLMPAANARRELIDQDKRLIDKKDVIADKIIKNTENYVGSLDRNLLGRIRSAAVLAKLAPQWEDTMMRRELRNTNNACENAIKKIGDVLVELSSLEE